MGHPVELNFKLDFRCEMFCLCLNFNKLRLGNIPVFAALKFKFRKLNQEPRQLSVFSNQFLERDAPYNPLCTHYSNDNDNDNDNDNVVGHSTKYTFYRVTY